MWKWILKKCQQFSKNCLLYLFASCHDLLVWQVQGAGPGLRGSVRQTISQWTLWHTHPLSMSASERFPIRHQSTKLTFWSRSLECADHCSVHWDDSKLDSVDSFPLHSSNQYVVLTLSGIAPSERKMKLCNSMRSETCFPQELTHFMSFPIFSLKSMACWEISPSPGI